RKHFWIREAGRLDGCATSASLRRVFEKDGASRAEVAEPFRARRNRAPGRSREAPNAFPFHAAEEEELVFLDRPAEAPAEIVIAEHRFGNFDRPRLIEKVVGVELVVAQVLEGAAVKLISAAARHDVDRSARITPEFGREV